MQQDDAYREKILPEGVARPRLARSGRHVRLAPFRRRSRHHDRTRFISVLRRPPPTSRRASASRRKTSRRQAADYSRMRKESILAWLRNSKNSTPFGQSIWLDNIRRGMFASGRTAPANRFGTARHDVQSDDLRESDRQRQRLRRTTRNNRSAPSAIPITLFEALAIDDIQPRVRSSFGRFSRARMVAMGSSASEVSPLLAHDTQQTSRRGQATLGEMVDRPNVMIKIPVDARRHCRQFTEAIAARHQREHYLDLFDRDVRGDRECVHRRARTSAPRPANAIDRVASVASVFVSRIDTRGGQTAGRQDSANGHTAKLASLLGKTGIREPQARSISEL